MKAAAPVAIVGAAAAAGAVVAEQADVSSTHSEHDHTDSTDDHDHEAAQTSEQESHASVEEHDEHEHEHEHDESYIEEHPESTLPVEQHEEVSATHDDDEASASSSRPVDEDLPTEVVEASGAEVHEETELVHPTADEDTHHEDHDDEPATKSNGTELEDLVSMLEGTSVRRSDEDVAGEIPDE